MIQSTGMMERNKALFSGKHVEYVTPLWLYQELDSEFHFTLDPCTSEDNPMRTPLFYTTKDNGLKKSWSSESVYCNPPYNGVKDWVKKSFDSVYVSIGSGRAKVVVMLLAARTDTEWFHRYVYNNKRAEVRFLRGRLKFGGEHTAQSGNTAPFPSMIVIFRPS